MPLINVSAAFKNCAFHAIATYLLAHNKSLPEELFQASKGSAGKLATYFSSEQAFNAWFEHIREWKKKTQPELADAQQGEMFEKILLLGICFRQLLAELLRIEPEAVAVEEDRRALSQSIQAHTQEHFLKMVNRILEVVAEGCPPDYAIALNKEDAYGALCSATEPFLKQLTSDPTKPGADKAIKDATNYWQGEGCKAYADYLGQEDHLISYIDILPLCHFLGLSLHVYDYQPASQASKGRLIFSEEERAGEAFTVVLDTDAAHYHVVVPEHNEVGQRLVTDTQIYERSVNDASTLEEPSTADKQRYAAARSLLFVGALLSAAEQEKSQMDTLLARLREVSGRPLTAPTTDRFPYEPMFTPVPVVSASVSSSSVFASTELHPFLVEIVKVIANEPVSGLSLARLQEIVRNAVQEGIEQDPHYQAFLLSHPAEQVNMTAPVTEFYRNSKEELRGYIVGSLKKKRVGANARDVLNSFYNHLSRSPSYALQIGLLCMLHTLLGTVDYKLFQQHLQRLAHIGGQLEGHPNRHYQVIGTSLLTFVAIVAIAVIAGIVTLGALSGVGLAMIGITGGYTLFRGRQQGWSHKTAEVLEIVKKEFPAHALLNAIAPSQCRTWLGLMEEGKPQDSYEAYLDKPVLEHLKRGLVADSSISIEVKPDPLRLGSYHVLLTNVTTASLIKVQQTMDKIKKVAIFKEEEDFLSEFSATGPVF